MSQQVIMTAFLTSGPIMKVVIDGDYLARPQMTAPIEIGTGGRECIFWPREIELLRVNLIPFAEKMRQKSVRGTDGRTVDVFFQPDPGQWYLHWPLQKGGLYIHVREEDGYEKVLEIAENLYIAESDDGLPGVSPDPPLSRHVFRVPGYEERLTFVALVDNTFAKAIELKRPGHLAEGAEYSTVESGKTVYTLGGPRGIDILVNGDVSPEEAQRSGHDLAESIGQSA